MKNIRPQTPPTKLFALVTTLLIIACALSIGSSVQAQSSIANVYPNGNYKFQSSPTLSFTASSPAGVTNVSVQLSATKMTGGTLIRNLTSAGGLIITGPATSQNVSAPLTTNRIYSVIIQITDSNGNTSITNLSFDTISGYTFEAEDFDYNSGQSFDNPQTNAYATLSAVGGVDAYNTDGGGQYRPVGTSDNGGAGLATEDGANGGDIPPRVQYIGTGKTDYDVGYTSSGDWGNYTRHYPAGIYNIYMRAANPNGPATDAASIAVVSGNASLSAAGTFAVPTTGDWQKYTWVPLLDANQNPVSLTIPDEGSGVSLNTLRASTDPSGSYNVNFYLLLRPDPAPVAGEAIVTNMYPDGTFQFQQTNKFVFKVISTNGINASDITVQLGATNLAGVGTMQLLTGGNGLAVTGSSTSLSVSATLTTNTVYTAFIQIVDSFGNVSTTNVIFDTINQNYYTFEAEDWDYNNGSFFNNPQINAYANLDGVNGVDFSGPTGQGSSDLNRTGLSAETARDIPRLGYIGTTNPVTQLPYIDDDVNPGSGTWANYTRDYPAGIYNIYVRAATANGGAVADQGSFSIVTSGAGTPVQATSKIGTYSMVYSGDWQKYIWRPVMDAGGNIARVTLPSGGTASTLRHTYDNSGANQNFYMLVPADTSVNFKPFVSDFSPDGSVPFQYTNTLTFTVHSSVGMPSGNILLNVDGGNVSGLVISGSSTLWNVSFPVSVNGFHTAIVTISDSVGTSISTNTFDTFDPNNYTFEVEDYDYNSGLFIDNPQIGSYSGLGSTLNVDDYWDYNVGVGYRPSSGAGDGLAFESPSGDSVRPGYSSADYDVGHNDGNNWANYTRNYPAGSYNIWMRYASPNGSPLITDAAKISLVTNGWGTTNQATTQLGTFTTRNTGGWGTYKNGWAPLIDANGNYVKWTASGSTNTLKYTVDSGGYNVDFFALVPADTTRPTISGLYPNGLTQFQGTNTLSFNAISSEGISTNSIVVTLNGVVITNLVFTGSSTSWHVSYLGLQANSFYSASISFSTLLGGTYSTSISFDTYSPTNYQWEAEDWDYTSGGISGLFFDNPQVDSYVNKLSAEGIDVSQTNPNTTGNPFNYRPYDGINLTPAQEPSGDVARPQFGTINTDYKLDWFGFGSWCNYTRHYPAGTYYVIGRFTEGSAATVATLSKVTSGFGTPSQITTILGTFFIPLGSWSTSESVYLTDNNTNLVTVTLDGSQTTLRLSGNPVALNDPTINVNYMMLVPATTPLKITAITSGGNIHLSFPTQNGSTYQMQYKTHLTDAGWTSLGSPISGNDSVQSISDVVNGASRFYRVQKN